MPENRIPKDIKDQYEKASMAVDTKNYDYAIELLTHLIKIRPDFAQARQLLILAEIKGFEKNKPNILLRVIRRLFSFINVFIALISETQGNNYKAISLYESILRKDPKNTGAMVRLGNLLKIEGLTKASAVTLENVIIITQKSALAYELLGELYSDLGNYDRARFCFKSVIKLKVHDANAERGLKNLDALSTIDKSFEQKGDTDFRIREITE